MEIALLIARIDRAKSALDRLDFEVGPRAYLTLRTVGVGVPLGTESMDAIRRITDEMAALIDQAIAEINPESDFLYYRSPPDLATIGHELAELVRRLREGDAAAQKQALREGRRALQNAEQVVRIASTRLGIEKAVQHSHREGSWRRPTAPVPPQPAPRRGGRPRKKELAVCYAEIARTASVLGSLAEACDAHNQQYGTTVTPGAVRKYLRRNPQVSEYPGAQSAAPGFVPGFVPGQN